jgi:hypothetical protein
MRPGTFTVASEPGATADEVAVVRDGLHEFNFAATGRRDVHEMKLLVEWGIRYEFRP